LLTRPSYNELLKRINSKYQLVTVAARRAAQLVENANLARQGLIPKYRPPQVDFFGKNFLTIALEEIALGKVEMVRRPKKKAQTPEMVFSSGTDSLVEEDSSKEELAESQGEEKNSENLE